MKKLSLVFALVGMGLMACGTSKSSEDTASQMNSDLKNQISGSLVSPNPGSPTANPNSVATVAGSACVQSGFDVAKMEDTLVQLDLISAGSLVLSQPEPTYCALKFKLTSSAMQILSLGQNGGAVTPASNLNQIQSDVVQPIYDALVGATGLNNGSATITSAAYDTWTIPVVYVTAEIKENASVVAQSKAGLSVDVNSPIGMIYFEVF